MTGAALYSKRLPVILARHHDRRLVSDIVVSDAAAVGKGLVKFQVLGDTIV
jgi:hypothetical protein